MSGSSDFAEILKQATITTGNKTAWSVTDLPPEEDLFVRVRYTSDELGVSEWSGVIKFTTIGVSINNPSVIFNEPTIGVGETPTFSASAFATTPPRADTHLSSSWKVTKEAGDIVVWSLNRSIASKSSVEIPKEYISTRY